MNFEHETFDVEAARTFVSPLIVTGFVRLKGLNPHHAAAFRAWRVFQRIDGVGLFHPNRMLAERAGVEWQSLFVNRCGKSLYAPI